MFRRTAIAVGVNFVVAVALLAVGVGGGSTPPNRGDGERWATGPTLPADAAQGTAPDAATSVATAPAPVPTPVSLGPMPGPVSGASEPESTTATGPKAAAAARPVTATGRPAARPTGRVDERSDNAGGFTYAADGQHTQTSSVTATSEDPFHFEVHVTPKERDRVAGVRINLVNRSRGPVEFPDGLRVVLRLKHRETGGERAVDLVTPEIRKVGDGGSVAMTGEVPLDKYGGYDYVATVLVDYGV